jgi:hypothetical protein
MAKIHNGIIVLLTVIGFAFAACGDKPEKEISGRVTANADGEISFMYSRLSSTSPADCMFTTNLPAPDDRFTLTITAKEPTGKKNIDGLKPGQVVTWTAKVEGKALNHGSGYFVHIINE